MGETVEKKKKFEWVKKFYKFLDLAEEIECIAQDALNKILADGIIYFESQD